jgi:hypothetical protein
MKTLTVGQKVWMQSGDQFREGTVIGISDTRIEVEPATTGDFGGRFALHFRKNGLGKVSAPGDQCGVFVPCGNSWGEWDRRPLCTEFGPWKLVEQGPDE